MPLKDWDIPGADGQPIIGTTHIPERDAVGVALLCHGFKGYKDYGLFPHLASQLAQRGFIAHRFNFSHSGMTRHIETFERPDLFRRDTWSKQIHDLLAVVAGVASGELEGRGLPAVWFGHSRGGITVLLTASRLIDIAGNRTHGWSPAGIIAAAAPASACNLDDVQRRMMRKLGYLPSPSSRTGQELEIGVDWLDELEAAPDAFDPVKAIARLTMPILLLYGDSDQTVPPAASALLGQANPNATVKLIPDASHTFNCPNPLPDGVTPPTQTVKMAEAVCAFARACLK